MSSTKKIKCYANVELLVEGTSKKHKFRINRRLGGYTLEETIKELEKLQQEVNSINNYLKVLNTKKPVSRLGG